MHLLDLHIKTITFLFYSYVSNYSQQLLNMHFQLNKKEKRTTFHEIVLVMNIAEIIFTSS
jgi:hypothetical protein